MSIQYKLTRDVSGATSSALEFTDEVKTLYFGPSWALQEVYAPTSYGQYIVSIEAYPTAAFSSGVNNIVAKIRYYPDPAKDQHGYCIYNGTTVYKKIVGGCRMVVDIPRNTGQGPSNLIDPACGLFFHFYNL
jgi:hypothetical protein